MPELRMRPMTVQEFAKWRLPQIVEYAAEMARNAGRTTEDLMSPSEREFDGLLPQGSETPGHLLLIAEDAGTGEQIGWLWIAERDSDAGKVAWIYDIVVNEALRGKGYGGALMAQAEVHAREMGVGRIELNVFADNGVAKALYESSGYRETSRQMAKDL